MISIAVRLSLVVATVFVLSLPAYTQTCSGSSGCLDQTFGIGGIATTQAVATDNNLSPGKGAVQSDGKILELGDAHLNIGNSFSDVVIRLDAFGNLDTSFASGGFLYMNWNGPNGTHGFAFAITTQFVASDEKIIVAGSAASGGLRVDRYNSDGSADTSFGTNGRATITNGGYALTVKVQPDGKILTIGDVGVMARLNANGTPDLSFGSGGVVQTSLNARTLGLQSTNKILTCGGTLSGKSGLFLARYNPNGTIDTGFGVSGKLAVEQCSIKVDPTDRILLGGTVVQSVVKKTTYTNLAVRRLLANGASDQSFGNLGLAAVDFAGFSENLWKVEMQSDGKILLVADVNATATNKVGGVARFNSNGTLDAAFGNNGRVMTDFSPSTEYTRDGMIQLDPICGCEKIVIVGTAELSGIDYAVAARYTP
jgi:uncharacterized delta-60 repeat protein